MQRGKRLSDRTEAVVVGFDGSPGGAAALRWAAGDAVSRNCRLRVVRAWQWDEELPGLMRSLKPADMETVAWNRTWATFCDVCPDLSRRPDVLEVEISGDEPGRAILSGSHRAAVIAVGRRRLRARERVFVGSVSDFVLETASCPVVVVPSAQRLTERSSHELIVVGVDGSSEARGALAFGAGPASRRNAGLAVVFAQFEHLTRGKGANETLIPREPMDGQHRLLREAAEQLRCLSGASGVPLELRLGTDEPGPCLVAAAASGQLLVVGSHGRGWLGRLALGSVSRYCVDHATVPVAVVRGS